MDDQVKSTGKKFVCLECKNENELSEEVQIGDVVECSFCGLEYEVTSEDEEGNYDLRIIEEEK